jgi:hypothetical protein
MHKSSQLKGLNPDESMSLQYNILDTLEQQYIECKER